MLPGPILALPRTKYVLGAEHHLLRMPFPLTRRDVVACWAAL